MRKSVNALQPLFLKWRNLNVLSLSHTLLNWRDNLTSCLTHSLHLIILFFNLDLTINLTVFFPFCKSAFLLLSFKLEEDRGNGFFEQCLKILGGQSFQDGKNWNTVMHKNADKMEEWGHQTLIKWRSGAIRHWLDEKDQELQCKVEIRSKGVI